MPVRISEDRVLARVDIQLIDPIRALVMRDACLVFVPDGADSLLSLLKEKFHESNQDMTTQAFELRYVYVFETKVETIITLT